MNYQKTYYLFCSASSFTSLAFVCFCLYEYSLNEDISQVTFQEFHKREENIYPSLTICLSSIFLEDEFVTYGQGINHSTYTDYLYGDHWDDRMIDIDYDNVTKNFEDYLLGIAMLTPDWRHLEAKEYFLYDHYKTKIPVDGNVTLPSTSNYNWKPKFYISYRGVTQKCFTADIPYTQNEKVWTFGLVFDSHLFPGAIRPWADDFGVKIHYPGQFFHAKMQKYIWNVRDSNSSDWLNMKFKIQKLEVIKHRETKKKPCYKNWTKDDKHIMTEKIKRVGCKPSHWKMDTKLPICKFKKQMEEFLEFDMTLYQPACQSIQKILHTYEEQEDILLYHHSEWSNKIDGIFEVVIEFQDGTYMEVQQVRDYGFLDVVGDIGGYLGLFLGFALLQIPDLIFKIYWGIADIIKQKRGKFTGNHQTDDRKISTKPIEFSVDQNAQKIQNNNEEINSNKRAIEDIRATLQLYALIMEDLDSYA